MGYSLFLFDADDTLFDFRSAELQALHSTLGHLAEKLCLEMLFNTYRSESESLWRQLERNLITKDDLKVERFRRTFAKHGITSDPAQASETYLEALSEADILNEHALEICQFLSEIGEVGIVTNGIVAVQKRRLNKSPIRPFISFIAVSEECGYAKPDIRFFDYSTKLARNFTPSKTLVIGDRIETDILGAHKFGLDACLFAPNGVSDSDIRPKYTISRLSELKQIALQ